MRSKLPWLDSKGLLHGTGPTPLALESTMGQAWLAAATGAFAVQFGEEPFTVRAELQNERRYWYATKRCEGKLHRWYIGLSNALTLGRLQEIAGEVALRCAETEPLPILDMQAAQSLAIEARAALEQQGRLGRRVGQQLLSLAEQAIAALEAAQQRLAALEQQADEPEAPEEQAPVPPPISYVVPEQKPSSSVKLVGATEEEVIAQIAEHRTRYGERLVIGSPTPAPRGGWMVYGLLRSEQELSERPIEEAGLELSAAPEPAAIVPYDTPSEPPQTGFPALDEEVQRVLAVQQGLHRFLDQQHEQELLNAKRGQVLVDLLREAVAHRQRVLMLEMVLEYLPQLALEEEEKQEQILMMIPLAAARKPALQKLRDQVEDQAAIVGINVAESRKLVGRARSTLLNLAWKIHGELGTSRLQRLWNEAEDYGLDPEQWVEQLVVV